MRFEMRIQTTTTTLWPQNREKALKYLLAALDHGWTNVEWTKQQEEFSILHNTPEWNAVLARMNKDVVEG